MISSEGMGAKVHVRLNQLQLNARDRYLHFIDDFPKMESVAKNFYIASYLGITKQSLSRIRSQK